MSGARRNQSLQDRSRRTRERLIEVGFSLFARHGFDEVTVDAICAATGVAKGTFYFHFPTKQALLVAAFHRGGDEVVRHAQDLAAAGTPFPEAVLALGARIANNTAAVPKPLARRATIEALAAIDGATDDGERHQRRRALVVLVEAGMRRGEVTAGFAPAEIAMALNWAMVQAILAWTASPGPAPTLETVMRARLTMLLAGVASRP